MKTHLKGLYERIGLSCNTRKIRRTQIILSLERKQIIFLISYPLLPMFEFRKFRIKELLSIKLSKIHQNSVVNSATNLHKSTWKAPNVRTICLFYLNILAYMYEWWYKEKVSNLQILPCLMLHSNTFCTISAILTIF